MNICTCKSSRADCRVDLQNKRHDAIYHFVIDTVRIFFQSVLLQPLEAALEVKPRVHLLFVRTKADSNGYKRTFWKKNEYTGI